MLQGRHNYSGNQNFNEDDVVQKVEIHEPPHLATLHVESHERLEITNYSSPRFETNNEIIRRTVNKIAMSELTTHYNIPNVNEQNYVLTFETATGIHTINLLVDFYTPTQLIEHIVIRLNTVLVASGVIFNSFNLYGNYFRLGGDNDFRFLDCPHIFRASCLSGLYKTDDFVQTLFITASGLYTQYIDFVSNDFRESQILENLFTKDYQYPIINHFYRYNIEDGTKPFNDKIQIKNLLYTTLRQREKNIISMSLYNQFGDLLYSPIKTYGTQKINIDLFKYEIKLSISV